LEEKAGEKLFGLNSELIRVDCELLRARLRTYGAGFEPREFGPEPMELALSLHCKKSIFALSYFNTLNLRKMQFLLSLRVFLLEYAEYNFKLN
jgi:hypothetical protein